MYPTKNGQTFFGLLMQQKPIAGKHDSQSIHFGIDCLGEVTCFIPSLAQAIVGVQHVYRVIPFRI